MNRLPTLAIIAALVLPFAGPALADDVSDALKAASDAYAGGDLKGTADELALAADAVRTKQIDLLNAFLPPAPDGWTSEINADYSKGFAMMGGGTGTEVTYSSDSGSFKLDITADNALVSSMAPMLASVAMMTAMGKVVKVGGLMALEQDDQQSLTALIANRVLVQMQGADTAVMLPVFQKINFDGLAKFDAK